jgi:signal transduction histidine kinase
MTQVPITGSMTSLQTKPARVRGFRRRLLVAMMLLGSALTGLALFLAEQNLAANIERELQDDFQNELGTLHQVQAIHHAVLIERCHTLVRKPRIHAALEDNALDLLYPNAEDEMRDLMATSHSPTPATGDAPVLAAHFYRFLDRRGAVIPAANLAPVGALRPAEEAKLALPRLPDRQQTGYLVTQHGGAATIDEVIATPIVSTETGEPIAALILGLKPVEVGSDRGLISGIWLDGQLYVGGIAESARVGLAREIGRMLATSAAAGEKLPVQIDGAPHLLFFKQLNPESLFSPAYEVGVYPLAPFAVRQRQLRWQILGLGAVLLIGAYAASHFFSARLSAPVEKLAIDSERSARFSADASHQLKTPVTVLRAGLEELLTRENLTAEECDAISALIHQTYQLSSLIEDLLLLSRMDAGRLKLALAPVDLTHLIDTALDDLSAAPDELEVKIETDVPPGFFIAGEKRYTAIILQNLLENARKYNRRGGRIRVTVRSAGPAIFVSIANTGSPISAAAQAHIFERFHRGAMGENVPGYGLGLNLAWELARLHQGDLRLLRSDGEWTAFEVRFQAAVGLTATTSTV